MILKDGILAQIIVVLGFISGFLCVLIILASVIKIMTGDEREKEIYTRRIKNALIALACIILFASIGTVNIFKTYFTTYYTNPAGTFTPNIETTGSGGGGSW